MSNHTSGGIAEPMAIVGMSCRFAPDLDSPEKLWDFLAGGRSAVGPMPDKRWEPYAASSAQATAILRGTTRLGSYLDDIEGFDADFFGISPREADFLDPQQRIVLELAWEALAGAGIAPLSLRGTEAGVFVSANSNDYGRRLLEDIPRTGAYAVNGTTYYGIANRVSYFLDLRGPSMAVDTACAGSLTALHLACASLQSGEVPVAIVGGVNIMATPALFVALDAAGATAPDGRSKAFDAAADGYGRGEGAGVVVLKRLSDAVRDGDPVLALIRGSGVFQDGRSDGMMAPSGPAQEHMLRRTYERSGISPDSVGYVEAHGTGTPVGDREEAQALAGVFGAGRADGDPCLIGSIKPNIGHTEACSGIAGVIKSVLALRRGQIPPSVHTEPNPDFDWAESGLRLVGELTEWPATGGPRRAGVSSYGVGGTTAHLILEQAPDAVAPAAGPADETGPAARPALFPVSAMSEAGLRAMAGAHADWLERNPAVPLASVGHTLAHRRSHLAQRGAVVARSREELTAGLRAVAEGRRQAGVATGRAGQGPHPGVVWVFSGHGAHWSGMGRELLRAEPEFAGAIDALGPVFEQEMGWTPRAALERGGPWTASEAQALTFAMQIGLCAVWRGHGVVPTAVIGHSVGEIAAAVAAGVLDLTEAARFACRRATALRQLEGRGAMVMAGLSFPEAELLLGDRTDAVAAIAASPRSTVISGDRDAVETLAAAWERQGIEIRRVDSDIAFHSAHADAVVDRVEAAAAQMHPAAAHTTLYTSALADPRSTATRDGGYWAANLRQPVRFAQAVDAAIEDGHRLFLEISSHPVVTHSITEALDHRGVEDAVVTGSSRRDRPEVETLLDGLARLHCHGAAVDWSLEQPAGDLADLPPAAWQHRPYWIFPQSAQGAGTGGGHDPEAHSLLGGRMTVSGSPSRQVWQTHLDLTCRPYPQSHEVVGVEITPAAAIINTFVLAAAGDGRIPGLTDVVLRTPLAVEPPRVVQVVLAENSIRLSSRIADGDAQDEESEWITHTTALVEAGRTPPTGTIDPAPIRERCEDVWDLERVDGLFRTKGVGGYAFPWGLDEIRTSGEEQLSILTLEPDAEHSASWAHVVDGALTISAVLVTPETADKLWMSSRMGSVSFRGQPPARITVHTVRNAISPIDTVDVLVSDERGEIVCEVGGLRFAPLQDQAGAMAAPRELVHEVVWQDLEPGIDGAVRSAVDEIVLVGEQSATGPLAEQFERAGVRCTVVSSPEQLRDTVLPADGAVLVAPSAGLDGEGAAEAAERCAWTLIRAGQVLAEAHKVVWEESAPKARLWALTRGVRDAAEESSLAYAPLWGIARIIAGEHPELWGGLVDVGAEPADGLGARLLPILRESAAQEDVISLSGDRAEVSRLTRIERAGDGGAISCRPTGSYLITGGLGALGLLVARWLVDRGATRLLLASRRGLPPRTEWAEVRDTRTRKQIDGVLALEALGVTVRVLSLDITDADSVAAALDPANHGLPPVRGIFHAAGVTRDAMLDKVDQNGLRSVLDPKAAGAMVLHGLFPPGSLDFFAMFSSCGQFARLTGQISYAAANSFLDALAAHRHASGHRETTSLAWTAWEGVGMSEAIAGTMAEANSRGLASISPAEAFRAWSFADRYQSPYLAVLKVLPLPAHVVRPPMFRELTAAEAAPGENQDGFAAGLAALSDEQLRDLIAEDVREQVGTELNLAAADVEPRRPLVELGVDSVMTVALRVRLNRRYGVDLPPTILWSKPTVAALTGHLFETVRPGAARQAEEPRAAA